MERQIRIRIPAHIRTILVEWGSACDPALIPMGNHDRQALSALYRALALEPGQFSVPRRTLATMYFNARMNSRFGLVAELRREGRIIVKWIEARIARDPVLGKLVEAPAPSQAQRRKGAAPSAHCAPEPGL